MVSEEVNFPTRYTVINVFMASGYNKFGHMRLFKCCIPVPCFLINERKCYKEGRDTYKEYEVVFTYEISSLIREKRLEPQVPEYTFFKNGKYDYSHTHIDISNSSLVSEIYEDYGSAREEAIKQNDELIADSMASIPVHEIETEYEKRMKIAEEFYDFMEKTIIKSQNNQKKLQRKNPSK